MMQMWKVKTNEKGVDIDIDGFIKSFGVLAQYSRGEAIKKAKLFNGRIVKGRVSMQGMCPMCQKETLEYPVGGELCDDMYCYPYNCSSCDYEGQEWFELSFQHHTDSQGNDI